MYIPRKMKPDMSGHLVEQYYPNPENYFNGRDLSYNLMLVYKTSEFLNLTQPEPKPKTRPQATCRKCGEPLDPDPFYAKHHHCEGTN